VIFTVVFIVLVVFDNVILFKANTTLSFGPALK
jgi:hypothetical protein